jgi:(R)-citramalyl-CoA lyase
MNVTIIDVAPRDGLQNEPEILAPAVRAELVTRLLAAGVPCVEVGSFVNPQQVPQMAGAAEVVTRLLPHGDQAPRTAQLTALVPNSRGYQLAVAAGLRHVRLVLAASERLNQANFKRSVAESLADFTQIAADAVRDGVRFGVAIGAAFGCPFTGHVPAERVLAIAAQLTALGAHEIILADTTGMAVPSQVRAVCAALPDTALRTIHLHNTRNTGYANAYAALEAGVTRFDAALGGIGGCPFAPRAVGNLATEDLVHMLNGMGVQTGIDLAALLETSDWLSTQLGKPLPALVGKAGPVYATVNQVRTEP